MSVFTLALARVPADLSLRAWVQPPNSRTYAGLVHSECFMQMELGAPIISPRRMQVSNLVMFAEWDSENAIDEFLSNAPLGCALATGWHMRMSFIRRWGSVSEFSHLPEEVEPFDTDAPVAAFTLARMKLPELPRFIKWGRPVEALVRDNPEATLSLAAIRYPRTVATFSVWNSQQAMRDMVLGHGQVDRPERHSVAMAERDRRNFHREFTTLRFKPISEHGSWKGQSNFVRQRQ